MADRAGLFRGRDDDDLAEGLEGGGQRLQPLGPDAVIIGDEDSLHRSYSL